MHVICKGITKAFGSSVVIQPLDLSIKHGSFTTLLGPSGCGKTTLLRMIAGLETPDTGEIWFDERCVFSKEQNINLPPEKRGLGFVFQDFALWPHMTVFENVAYGLRARKQLTNLKERVDTALKAVRLDGFSNRYPHQLSGGQQQRVAFARSIVIEPDCILFDEPLSALDAKLREEMQIEIKSLINNSGLTSIFVTHDQHEAMSMSDEIIVLNKGVVEQHGTPEEIYCAPATAFVARFVGRSNWIGDNTMFRPQDIRLEFCENSEQFQMVTEQVNFVGGAYELCLADQKHRWLYISQHKVSANQNLLVYIPKEKICTF